MLGQLWVSLQHQLLGLWSILTVIYLETELVK